MRTSRALGTVRMYGGRDRRPFGYTFRALSETVCAGDGTATLDSRTGIGARGPHKCNDNQ